MTSQDLHAQRLLIVDFGAQYTQLIARRIREAGVYCEIHPFDMPDEAVRAFAPKGIILSGGPESVTEQYTPRAPSAVFELGVPILGICYGMQTMAAQLGGKVESSVVREFGHAEINKEADNPLFTDMAFTAAGNVPVWMSHGDKVTSLPPGFVCISSTPSAPIAAMADHARQWYGVQFHPRSHTYPGWPSSAGELRPAHFRL